MRLLSQLFLAGILSCASANTCSAAGDTVAVLGTKQIWLHDNKPAELARLGMVWGFLKYHHPAATSGSVDMDAELIKVMPKVLAAANTDSAMKVIEKWVDALGKPSPCKKCAGFVNGPQIVTGPDYGMLFINEMPQPLRDKLDYILVNRPAGARQHYVQMVGKTGSPQFANERSYDDNALPDAGTRLLGLFRYWNMVQYYSPARHLAARNRGRMLADMVIEFANATDTLSYQLACLKLVTRINDGYTVKPLLADRLEANKGAYVLPFTAQFVDEQLVVTSCDAGVTNVRPGDVIEAIDGMMTLDVVRRYIDVTPAANFKSKLNQLAGADGFLLRSHKQEATLSVTRGSSAPQQVSLKRVPIAGRTAIQRGPACTLMAGNVGYVNGRMAVYAAPNALRDSLAGTQALVLDLRGCSTAAIPASLQWLMPGGNGFAKEVHMIPDVPGAFELGEPSITSSGQGNGYKGKMAILVDAATQGGAEYLVIALQSVPGTTVLGISSAGTAGTPASITFPGGVQTSISGTSIYYTDGTTTQGSGVRVNATVSPTVAGLAAGKDELLEAAIQALQKTGTNGSAGRR